MLERYSYKEGDYRPRVRSGGDCDSCGRRSACPVDDKELKKWQTAGYCCMRWKPDKPGDFTAV